MKKYIYCICCLSIYKKKSLYWRQYEEFRISSLPVQSQLSPGPKLPLRSNTSAMKSDRPSCLTRATAFPSLIIIRLLLLTISFYFRFRVEREREVGCGRNSAKFSLRSVSAKLPSSNKNPSNRFSRNPGNRVRRNQGAQGEGDKPILRPAHAILGDRPEPAA